MQETAVPKISPSDLTKHVTYNADTGVFRRAKVTGYRGAYKIGEVVGSVNLAGYRTIKIDGITYLAHRMAYAIMTGDWPPADMDHVNGVKDDNRWANLRAATRAENQWNTTKRKDNKSGFKGVFAHGDRWRSYIQCNKKRFHLGVFDTAEQAAAAYVKKQNELHQEFARVGEGAKKMLARTNLLNSGLDVEWQSWPLDKPRPALWATGRVEATAEFFDQIASWYPDFGVRICQDQPEAALRGKSLIAVLEAYA